ncbi:MAG: hypothetical protein U0941_00565 [Planctomycetaceae bacterium]
MTTKSLTQPILAGFNSSAQFIPNETSVKEGLAALGIRKTVPGGMGRIQIASF